MTWVALRAAPPSRVTRAPERPRPRPQATLRAIAPRPRLIAPLIVTPPPRPPRRQPQAVSPVPAQPVLRLPAPRPPAVPRLVLRAPVPAPAPLLTAPVNIVPIAEAVGILGIGGTRVIMVPADLTQPGRVDITRFRIGLAAGVW